MHFENIGYRCFLIQLSFHKPALLLLRLQGTAEFLTRDLISLFFHMIAELSHCGCYFPQFNILPLLVNLFFH